MVLILFQKIKISEKGNMVRKEDNSFIKYVYNNGFFYCKYNKKIVIRFCCVKNNISITNN